MGQCYTAIMSDKEKGLIGGIGIAHKLTESSWFGNPFMNATMKKILDNPRKVAWVGDYAKDLIEESQSLSIEKVLDVPSGRMVFIDNAQGELNSLYVFSRNCADKWAVSCDPLNNSGFLINHDTKEYINIERYIERYTYDTDWCMHPLPLLTAIGNGEGGGDYYECFPNYDKCGIWAWDTLSYSKFIPEGFIDRTDEYWFSEDDKYRK